ncbi:MAG: NADP-dependent malic enzyme [Patescibacteria group bacterium]|nr:NADP-dependent malic enzyme [Patescibacteria group bacterium]
MPEDIYQASMDLHAKYHGKLEIKSKVPLNDKQDLSLAYTPGVAEVCRAIVADPAIAYSHTYKGNTVAVLTDGSAILGLGNLGAEAALPVMEGKCILFKEFANVDAFPICLDTQDVEEIIATAKHLAPTFAGINLEDISAPRCFEIEKRLKAELKIPVMHDDQHGTATVVLAGLINALRLKKMDKGSVKIVVNGAGAAGTAIIKLLLKFGFVNIIVCDRQGAIYLDRPELSIDKKELASLTNHDQLQGNLAEVIKGADIFIGVSTKDILSKEMVQSMANQPAIFALANPSPEINPVDAREAGAFIMATGRSDFNNQINNVLVFPGVFRGALDRRVAQITDEMLIQAAINLADYVTDLTVDNILPKPLDKGVVEVVAKAIC